MVVEDPKGVSPYLLISGYLRREAVDLPGVVGLAGVEEAVVESVFSALPKFDGLGGDAVAAPECGQWHFSIGELAFDFRKFLFEDLPGGQHTALARGPGAQPAFEGACKKIFEGLGSGDFFGPAGKVHLPAQGEPGEGESDLWVFGYLAGFDAFVVGEKNESSGVEAFEQDGAGSGARIGRGGGENHGGGFVLGGLADLVEPFLELLEGVGGHVRAP